MGGSFEPISPVLIVGMHRSGTSLTARLLEKAYGVFMGSDTTRNHESRFYQQINRHTLDSFGCSWRTLQYLPSSHDLQHHYDGRVESIRQLIRKKSVKEYWGGWFRGILGRGRTWGWKDPRTSLLLPIWSRVFPDAAILHVYRDGRDVALSLLRRDVAYRGGRAPSSDHLKRRYIANLRLWEEYWKRVDEGLPLFERGISISYESLVDKPEATLTRVGGTLGLASTSHLLQSATSTVDSSRTERFTDPEFSWIREITYDSPLLKTLGYTSMHPGLGTP